MCEDEDVCEWVVGKFISIDLCKTVQPVQKGGGNSLIPYVLIAKSYKL